MSLIEIKNSLKIIVERKMIILNKFDVISDFFVTLSSLVDKEWTIETI